VVGPRSRCSRASVQSNRRPKSRQPIESGDFPSKKSYKVDKRPNWLKWGIRLSARCPRGDNQWKMSRWALYEDLSLVLAYDEQEKSRGENICRKLRRERRLHRSRGTLPSQVGESPIFKSQQLAREG